MKTVESVRKGVHHLANNDAKITLCGLLTHRRWVEVHHKSGSFFAAPRLKRCETCTRIAAKALDRMKVVV